MVVEISMLLLMRVLAMEAVIVAAAEAIIMAAARAIAVFESLRIQQLQIQIRI